MQKIINYKFCSKFAPLMGHVFGKPCPVYKFSLWNFAPVMGHNFESSDTHTHLKSRQVLPALNRLIKKTFLPHINSIAALPSPAHENWSSVSLRSLTAIFIVVGTFSLHEHDNKYVNGTCRWWSSHFWLDELHFQHSEDEAFIEWWQHSTCAKPMKDEVIPPNHVKVTCRHAMFIADDKCQPLPNLL